MKLYEGAFLPNFQWPQPKPDSEETSEEEGLSWHLWRIQLWKQKPKYQTEEGHLKQSLRITFTSVWWKKKLKYI